MLRTRAHVLWLGACVLGACAGSSGTTGTPIDAGAIDGGVADAGPTDSGAVDAGPSDAGPIDGSPDDAGPADAGAPLPDGGAIVPCSIDGEPGQCLDVSDCAAMSGSSSTPGYCPGPANIECCARVPSVADNPPIPAGYQLMQQSQVTSDMTTWAVAILHDPVTYPLFSTTTMTFGTQLVLARVEWHPPDFQNSVVHRGVTLYVQI